MLEVSEAVEPTDKMLNVTLDEDVWQSRSQLQQAVTVAVALAMSRKMQVNFVERKFMFVELVWSRLDYRTTRSWP